jgi:dipeptidyl-peptidase-4
VKGDLVWVDLASGARRRLTRTKSPISDLKVSPDARHVSFVRAHDLWVVPVAEGEERPLTTGGSDALRNGSLDWLYPEELGHDTGHWWAPDSTRVAFLQLDESQVPRYRVPGLLELRSEGTEMYYPKAGDPNPVPRVGVVALEGGDPHWLWAAGKGPHYVVRVSWHCDSRHLLVLGMPRSQESLHASLHAVERAAEAPSVAPVPPLYSQMQPSGWVNPPQAPRFEEGARLLFGVGGSRGAWSAATVEDGPASARLKDTTHLTAKDVDASDLLHVRLVGEGAPEALYEGTRLGSLHSQVFRTAGARTETLFEEESPASITASLSKSGRHALVRRSTATRPPTLELWDVAANRRLETLGDSASEELASLRLAVPEHGEVEIPGCAAGTIRYRLWLPADLDESRRYGLIVHVYGGPGSRMIQDEWGHGPLLHTLFTQRGFLVLQVDGRGTTGQGPDFCHLVKGRLGVLELEDQVRAVEAVLQRPYLDRERVGIWGWSYGGFMAAYALVKRSDVFRAGVAVASVTDWRLYDTIYTERYMGLPSENAKGYAETSVIEAAKGLGGHLLLLHGLGDDNVHAQNTFRLVEALIQAKKTTYETMIYPGRGHGIGGAGYDVFHRLVAHFERHLAPASR